MTQVTLTAEGESCSVILSEIHKFHCLIVKTKDLLKKAAMSGIYVDVCLTVGPPKVVDALMKTLRKLLKTSDPQHLSYTQNLTFLGGTLTHH